MIKSRKILITLAFLFTAVEFIFWVLILLGIGNNILQFSSVVIAFAVSLIFLRKNTSSICVSIGLLFTCFADFCLVLLDPIKQIPAMLFFSVTQLSYAIKLYNEENSEKRKPSHIHARICAIIILETCMLIILGKAANLLSIITMFYFANLILNAVFSKISGKSVLFFIGLLLFIGCDIFVGLDVLISDYISVSDSSILYRLTHLGFNTVWFFYIPSQTLITLSMIQKRKNKKSNNI